MTPSVTAPGDTNLSDANEIFFKSTELQLLLKVAKTCSMDNQYGLQSNVFSLLATK